jgi:hypothetical protein
MENLLARVKQEKKAFRARNWEESTKAKALQRYRLAFLLNFPTLHRFDLRIQDTAIIILQPSCAAVGMHGTKQRSTNGRIA